VTTTVKRFDVLMPWNTAISPGNRLKVGSLIYDVLSSDFGRGNATKVIADCTRT
jgi:hypothetical protein